MPSLFLLDMKDVVVCLQLNVVCVFGGVSDGSTNCHWTDSVLNYRLRWQMRSSTPRWRWALWGRRSGQIFLQDWCDRICDGFPTATVTFHCLFVVVVFKSFRVLLDLWLRTLSWFTALALMLSSGTKVGAALQKWGIRGNFVCTVVDMEIEFSSSRMSCCCLFRPFWLFSVLGSAALQVKLIHLPKTLWSHCVAAMWVMFLWTTTAAEESCGRNVHVKKPSITRSWQNTAVYNNRPQYKHICQW